MEEIMNVEDIEMEEESIFDRLSNNYVNNVCKSKSKSNIT